MKKLEDGNDALKDELNKVKADLKESIATNAAKDQRLQELELQNEQLDRIRKDVITSINLNPLNGLNGLANLQPNVSDRYGRFHSTIGSHLARDSISEHQEDIDRFMKNYRHERIKSQVKD